MIVLTGGAGFIGSNLLKKLNDENIENIIVVDSLDSSDKWKNLIGKRFVDYYDKDMFLKKIQNGMNFDVETVFHFGACSSTIEKNADYLIHNNFFISKVLLEWALSQNIRFIYASSAATYGDGSSGFSDSNDTTLKLKPLNIYGYSKQLFDEFLVRRELDKKVTGLKMFNVFGPNEYHKGKMRSIVIKAFEQVDATGKIRLFKSNDPNFRDGEQKRDFIYVKDCIDIIWWLYKNSKKGIYNVGSGKANTWMSLARAVFKAMDKPEQVEFIDMPEILLDKYQNYTSADITKLVRAGFDQKLMSLNEAVDDYIRNYLLKNDQYN